MEQMPTLTPNNPNVGKYGILMEGRLCGLDSMCDQLAFVKGSCPLSLRPAFAGH